MSGTFGTVVAIVVIGVPVLVFLAWPFLRRGANSAFLPLPVDAREQLLEQKRGILNALRELEFEHEAGHVSDEDYRGLRARYETEAAGLLDELDRMGAPPAPAPEPEPEQPATAGGRSAWQHPAALGVGAAAMVIFGVVLGVGIVRYTAPEPPAQGTMGGGGMPGGGGMAGGGLPGAGAMPGGAPGGRMPGGVGAIPGSPGTVPMPGGNAGGDGQPIPAGVLQGMLQAARQALNSGNYSEAIAAYQAILRREPKNIDAMTHLALIVAMGGHSDTALQTFDKVLAIDPNYAPALLYRGQVLYEAKGDAGEAIKSWEKFLAVAPPGEDRDRVKNMIATAKSRPAPAKPQ